MLANRGEFTPFTKHGIPWVGNGIQERGFLVYLWVGRQWFRNVIPRPDGRINVLD
uniref:Uncharacterized protein n=1 Tax=Helianthus annuus TaxID=4232 RepID=A0A251UV63_HELAN